MLLEYSNAMRLIYIIIYKNVISNLLYFHIFFTMLCFYFLKEGIA